MEVVLQAPKTFSDNVKKKKILPVNQLVEETRRTGNVSHHLLETSVYNKVKINNVVEAEPSELHFSGFEVGKVYKKSVKLINISSEVLNVHILPTQTKYFSTEYTKKNRLVPGLSYTIIVHFSPDEWRYFFDSIRVHCKGEANLLVPVHAYPVIDDLRIPSHVRLPAVPLGHSTSHVIPLSCKCPIDFEFQVHCLKPHEAFTVQPLSGIIPANGKTHFTVTFTPQQYGTAEITLQLVISQFNSKPIVCTLTASCFPYRTLNSQQDNNVSDQMFADVTKTEVPSTLPAAPKHKPTPSILKYSKKKVQPETQPQTSAVDVSTPAGLVKMLVQHQGKMNYKDLREAMSLNKVAHQTRQMREAAFENHVLANVQKGESQSSSVVHLGESLWSTEQKMNVLREQEFAAAEYMMKNAPGGGEADFARVSSTLSSQRVLRNAGQLPIGSPVFHVYDSSSLEVRQRVLRVFQQAARKVILRCRMNNRLQLLRDLASKLKRHDGDTDTRPQLLKVSLEKLQPFQTPVFTPVDHLDDLAVNGLGCVPVRQIKLHLTPNIPLFNLKVPQHFRLKGYREMSPYEAGASYVRTELARTLRTGAQDELLPAATRPAVESGDDEELREEQDVERDLRSNLCFSAPTNMLSPPKAHPLRIFNPAPGVHVFKPTPLYLESDVDFHLCPLPRHTVSKSNVLGVSTPSTQKRFLDRKDVIKGIMTWKKFPSLAMTTFPSTSTRTNNWVPRLSDPFNSSLLPLQAPPGLQDLPNSMRDAITSDPVEGTENTLTPEMVQAEFAPTENVSSKPLKEDDREKRELLLQSTLKSQTNKLGPKVLARMKYLKSLEESSLSARDCK